LETRLNNIETISFSSKHLKLLLSTIEMGLQPLTVPVIWLD